LKISRVVTIVIALALLFFFFRGVQLGDTLHAIATASPQLIMLAVLIGVCEYPFRALRWHYLLSPVKKIGWTELLKPMLLSFAAGNITATGLGSFPRVIPIIKKYDVDRDFALGSVGAEIILDTAAVVAGAFIVSMLSPVPSSVRIGGIAFAAVLFVVVFFTFRYFKRMATTEYFLSGVRSVPDEVKGFARFKMQILGYLRDVITGLVLSLSNPYVLLRVLPLTILIWILEASMFYTVTAALGVGVSYLGGATTMVSTHIIIGMPSAPGFIGTLEMASSVALIALGVRRPLANAFALVMHAIIIIPSTMIGLYFWWKEKVPVDIVQIKNELGY
jgi:glycosyltransferase 2 family protein